MPATEDPVQYRLSALELARTLGNVAEACRQKGVSRSTFYKWKRRYESHGIAGLQDGRPIHKTHPMTTPPEVVERVLALSREHPSWGCTKLSEGLRIEGANLSHTTVQEILRKHGLGKEHERLAILERQAVAGRIELTAEQAVCIERANPCFRERWRESECPGELLVQDTLYAGCLRGGRRVYLQAVVDTYSSFAFGLLHCDNVREAAVKVLEKYVLPFYREAELTVTGIVTDKGRGYCGNEPPYMYFLVNHGISHETVPIPNGFVQRFGQIVRQEFFNGVSSKKLYRSVEELQRDFDEWLRHYNVERPHQGYRNMGRPPFKMMSSF